MIETMHEGVNGSPRIQVVGFGDFTAIGYQL